MNKNKVEYSNKFGPVAHLVERLTCTEEVAGSSPVRSTTSKSNTYLGIGFCALLTRGQDSKGGGGIQDEAERVLVAEPGS